MRIKGIGNIAKKEEADRVSWVMYYNLVGEAEDERIDIVKSGWEAVGE